MTVTKYISLGAAAFFGLFTFCLAMIRGGWPGQFIMPYLCIAAVLALVPAFFVWRFVARSWPVGVGTYSIAAAAFYLAFAFSAGPLVSVAEDVAVQVAMRVGYCGESGHRTFYPDDSGMSHWPTPWSRVPVVAGLLALIWLPCLYLVTLVSAALEKRARSR